MMDTNNLSYQTFSDICTDTRTTPQQLLRKNENIFLITKIRIKFNDTKCKIPALFSYNVIVPSHQQL